MVKAQAVHASGVRGALTALEESCFRQAFKGFGDKGEVIADEFGQAFTGEENSGVAIQEYNQIKVAGRANHRHLD